MSEGQSSEALSDLQSALSLPAPRALIAYVHLLSGSCLAQMVHIQNTQTDKLPFVLPGVKCMCFHLLPESTSNGSTVLQEGAGDRLLLWVCFVPEYAHLQTAGEHTG